MTQTAVAERASKQKADNTAIRPFHVNVPEEQLTELRRRINATISRARTVPDATQGVQLATIKRWRAIGPRRDFIKLHDTC